MLLIFPTEVGFDKKQFPVITLFLVILNIAVFFGFQLDEEKEQDKVFDYYQSTGLFTIELPTFKKYLQTPSAQKHYLSLSDVFTDGPSRIYFMVFDQEFREFLQKELAQQTSDEAQQWRWLAQELENKKMAVTSFAFGARPNNSSWLPLITHMFLHGDIGHLIGNMLFLFLFGLGVERLFGQYKFLIIYLGAGITGAVLFNFLNGKPFMPLVGASGAISGLMGAYAAYFGNQKIRFFAWFGFYFNQYKWPAMLVLLFWLAKELVSQLTETESNVAYMAHFGGLLAGGLIGLLLRPSQLVRNEEKKELDISAEQRSYSKALEHIRKLEFDEARKALHTTLEHTPWHFEALKSLYNLDKVNPSHARFKVVINRVFAFNLNDTKADHFVLSVAMETLPSQVSIKELQIDAFFGLLHRQLRNDRVQASEPLIKEAKRVYAENDKLPKLLFEWSMALAKREKIRSASIELNYLANYYGETPHGRAARDQLKSWKQ